jgi:flagellar biosynthesis repressor protein FlbT
VALVQKFASDPAAPHGELLNRHTGPAASLLSEFRRFLYSRLTMPRHHRPTTMDRRPAMSLKVELKPGEKIIIGDCVVTNHDQRTRLMIDGHAPILREKDILTPQRADTPAKRIYLAIQLMYTSKDPRDYHEAYFSLLRDITAAAPSVWPHIEIINNHILTGEMYKALKQAKKLIAYEQELLDDAKRGTSLRRGSETNRKSA